MKGRKRSGAILRIVFAGFFGGFPLASRADDAASRSGEQENGDIFDILDEDRKSLDIHEEVVTASGGVAEDQSLAAASSVVISRNDIERRAYRSLADILADIPGFYVIDDLVQPSVGVRGMTGGVRAGSRIVKIMINGTAVNFRPDLTAFLGPEYIPIESIERVEIAKGPLSALYGANAFLATVNIITRDPVGLGAEVAARGNYQAVNGTPRGGASGQLHAGNDMLGLLATFNFDQFDRSGLRLSKTFANEVLVAGASQHDISTSVGGYLQLYFKSPTAGTFMLQGGAQMYDSAAEFQVSSVLTHQSTTSLLNVWGELHHEKRWLDWLQSDIRIGYTQGQPLSDNTFQLTADVPPQHFAAQFGSQALDASANLTLTFKRVTVKAGVDGEYDLEKVFYYKQFDDVTGAVTNLYGTPLNPTQAISDIGVFLQASTNPFAKLDHLHLTANFRLDRVIEGPLAFPLQYSWRAAAAYQWRDDFVTKIVGGRAFQSPSPTLMFAESSSGAISNSLLGMYEYRAQVANPPQPQSINSVEFLAVGNYLQYFTVDAGVYFQQVDAAIQFVPVVGSLIAENLGSADYVGAELLIKGAFGPAFPYISASYQRDLSLGQNTTLANQTASPAFPDFQLVAGTTVKVAKIYLAFNAQVRAASERGATNSNAQLNGSYYALPAYVDGDLAISTLGLTPLGKNRETVITFSVKNIIDWNRTEPSFGGFDLPGVPRRFMLELRQRF